VKQTIPIQNLYYLLLYALEIKPLTDKAKLTCLDAPDLVNLYARLFGLEFRALRLKGLERAYVPKHEELGVIRGKVDFINSHRRQSRVRARVICEFEDLSTNILPNRILKATLELLLTRNDLDPDSRDTLRLPTNMLKEVDPIPLSAPFFHRVTLHRNNRHYRVLLNLCRLISLQLMPGEEQGNLSFLSLDRELAAMHGIFEKFVLNFAKIHIPEADSGARVIQWDGSGLDEVSRTALPSMRTDLSMSWPHRKLILDCKFYREALISQYEEQRLRSAHLYQLHAYLRNQAKEPGWENAAGILLYPAVEKDFDFNYSLSGHPVRVISLDLNQPWHFIEQALRDILLRVPGTKRSLEIEDLCFKPHPGDPYQAKCLHVKLGGQWYFPGEKYTILETGWALYINTDYNKRCEPWIQRHGEHRPGDENMAELTSSKTSFFTTHPVLVALSLRYWWHRNGNPMPIRKGLPLSPTFDEALNEVENRRILNPWNEIYRGKVPGREKWAGS
jgi:5-methylcytosine-specific restriction enzyme subunit McrC